MSRCLIDSPIFSLRPIEHVNGRLKSPVRSGAGRDSEGEHPGAQRCRSSDTTTAYGGRHHCEGFPRGQCPDHWIINRIYERCSKTASVQSVAPIQFSVQHRFTQLSQARDLRSSIGNVTLNPVDLFAELFRAIR